MGSVHWNARPDESHERPDTEDVRQLLTSLPTLTALSLNFEVILQPKVWETMSKLAHLQSLEHSGPLPNSAIVFENDNLLEAPTFSPSTFMELHSLSLRAHCGILVALFAQHVPPKLVVVGVEPLGDPSSEDLKNLLENFAAITHGFSVFNCDA